MCVQALWKREALNRRVHTSLTRLFLSVVFLAVPSPLAAPVFRSRYYFCDTQIVKEKTLQLVGMVGIFPAASVGGEDVEVYANESR